MAYEAVRETDDRDAAVPPRRRGAGSGRQPRWAAGEDLSPARLAELHRRYAASRDRTVRNQLIQAHAGLAHALAARFERRRDTADDLRQVAAVGLMKALDGFDPDKGLQFSTYATPTILGELKRHFRDRTWTVRVPRRLHDLYLQLQRARDDLAQEKGRSPTVAELAGRIGATEEDVIEAIDASEVRALTSLDAAVAGRDEAVHVGAVDDAIDDIERRMTVPALLEGLTPFEREVVRLRFYEALTQSEIAHRLDTNQMQISRTLARSLRRLRAMTNEE